MHSQKKKKKQTDFKPFLTENKKKKIQPGKKSLLNIKFICLFHKKRKQFIDKAAQKSWITNRSENELPDYI